MAKELNSDNYEEVVNSGKPAVIDFWATWFGPCRRVSPIIDELAEAYGDKVNIVKCDTEENDELTAKFGIMSIPTVLFFKDGEVVDKQIGAAAKSAYQDKIEALLK
jgi:thioredoxin 1